MVAGVARRSRAATEGEWQRDGPRLGAAGAPCAFQGFWADSLLKGSRARGVVVPSGKTHNTYRTYFYTCIILVLNNL